MVGSSQTRMSNTFGAIRTADALNGSANNGNVTHGEGPTVQDDENAASKLLGNKEEHSDGRIHYSEANQVGPDGGWGWLVCFACFVEFVLYDGIFYTFGITFLEISDHFEMSKGSGAWILSLNMGICMTAGPFIAALCNKFGFRLVTVIGSVVTFVGLLISCFVKNPRVLYFSYGIVAGLGYGMVFQPSITAVTLYFTKKRALATGLSMCGSGFGVFIMSPITERLLEHYSWNGTFLIQAAILLNGIVCGLIYRPVVQPTCLDDGGDTIHTNKSNCSDNTTIVRHHQRALKNDYEAKHHVPYKTTNNGVDYSGNTEEDYDLIENKNHRPVLTTNLENHATHTVNWTTESTENIGTECKVLDLHQQKHAKDPVFENGTALTSSCETNRRSNKRGYMLTLVQAMRRTKRNTIRIAADTFDMSLMKDASFCLYMISSGLYSLVYYIPFFYLPDVAKQAGIDSLRGALLLSAIGIASTICRVVFGVLSDRPCVNRLHLYILSLFFCGIITVVLPFCPSFEILLGASILFGVFQGSAIVLSIVLVADFVGTENACKGLGIMNLFSGIATFIGPPLAGLMYDVTRSYDVTFCVSGVFTSVSGVMLLIIPCLKSCRNEIS